MLDPSDNLNYCFLGCVVISNLYFFQEFALVNPCFIFSIKLILLLIDKLTTGI